MKTLKDLKRVRPQWKPSSGSGDSNNNALAIGDSDRRFIDRNDLQQAAKEWIKSATKSSGYIFEKDIIHKNEMPSIIKFIKYFFNIKNEDLK